MCQRVTGELRVLSERTAWKLVTKNRTHQGPYYDTSFRKDGWSKQVIPEIDDDNETCFGYHVFKTKRDAGTYLSCLASPYTIRTPYTIIKIRIRGQAIPFRGYRDLNWRGWAVAQWRPA